MGARWFTLLVLALNGHVCSSHRIDASGSNSETCLGSGGKKKSSCSLVSQAGKREGWHFTATCKCINTKDVLSAGCGSQAGERKFDITRLAKEVGTLPTLDCACVDQTTLQMQTRKTQEISNVFQKAEEATTTASKLVASVSCADKVAWSKERESWHLGSEKCKCIDHDAVLVGTCGRYTGERKFDVTGLPFDGCYCAPGPTTTKTTSATTTTPGCGNIVPHAVKRTGFHPLDTADCKCEVDWYLSKECGDLARTRKFNRKADDVKNVGCRCESELQQLSDEDLVGPVDVNHKNPVLETTQVDNEDHGKAVDKTPVYKEDEDTAIQKIQVDRKEHGKVLDKTRVNKEGQDAAIKNAEGESAMRTMTRRTTISQLLEPKCKHPQPEGFKFGDIVRIHKIVPDGYWVFFIPAYKKAGVHGKIAQVVCPQGTAGTEGRVCLREGGDGPRAAGCWLPTSLEKIESSGDKESDS